MTAPPAGKRGPGSKAFLVAAAMTWPSDTDVAVDGLTRSPMRSSSSIASSSRSIAAKSLGAAGAGTGAIASATGSGSGELERQRQRLVG
jgi:hypothetical protein